MEVLSSRVYGCKDGWWGYKHEEWAATISIWVWGLCLNCDEF